MNRHEKIIKGMAARIAEPMPSGIVLSFTPLAAGITVNAYAGHKQHQIRHIMEVQ